MEEMRDKKDEVQTENHLVKEGAAIFREISIMGVNECVRVVSSDPNDSTKYLSDIAFGIFMTIKTSVDKKTVEECQ